MVSKKVATASIISIAFIMFSIGLGLGYSTWQNNNNVNIAPGYIMNNSYDPCYGKSCPRTIYPSHFNDFWQEATKNTQFTVDGKPVEITDVQVFYKYYSYDEYSGPPITCPPPRLFYGNITYYPSGIENSQTYVAPTPHCWAIINDSAIGNLTIKWEQEIQCPTPTPTCSCEGK